MVPGQGAVRVAFGESGLDDPLRVARGRVISQGLVGGIFRGEGALLEIKELGIKVINTPGHHIPKSPESSCLLGRPTLLFTYPCQVTM